MLLLALKNLSGASDFSVESTGDASTRGECLFSPRTRWQGILPIDEGTV